MSNIHINSGTIFDYKLHSVSCQYSVITNWYDTSYLYLGRS